MVESHLQWCRTCAARVDDMRQIGAMLRAGSPMLESDDADAQEIAAIPAGVLLRIRTEKELSLGVRLPELFSDLRLFWPALGATTALVACVTGAMLVLQWSSQQRPESLAAMISTLAQPGSEGNPLRPDNGVRTLDEGMQQYAEENRLSGGISIPRALNDGAMFEGLGDGDAVFALSTVVSRDGRIANYEVLSEPGRGGHRSDQVDAVLADAMRQSRFAPAQTPGGNKVAVNMVWLIVSTTAVSAGAVRPAVTTRVVEVRELLPPLAPTPAAVPALVPAVPDGDRRSSLLGLSATV
jgi:hypothetical protein